MQPIEIVKKAYRRFVLENDIKKAYHKWIANNCQNSIYGKKLRKIKGIHNGEKCIIVGNGPSLSAEDLDAIHESGIMTFGTNRVFKIFPSTKWRPTYYVTEDPDIIKGFCNEIDTVPAKTKFIPLQIRWYETSHKFSNVLYFWQNYDPAKRYKYDFSPEIDRHIDHTGTVTCTCIQIAAYMGFSEIYLIGVDHNFKVSVDANGNTVVDNTVKDHFCENYNDDYIKNVPPPDLGKTTKSYMNMKTYCDENGIRICNSTRGGKLEVYDRIPLEEVLHG